MWIRACFLRFLSTPSARRATQPGHSRWRVRTISIHALREEGDYPHHRSASKAAYFYPRPPRGGRPTQAALLPSASAFLSTPSARRATWLIERKIEQHENFYPRPPRGGRQPPTGFVTTETYFYPRPPRGGRPMKRPRWRCQALFLSTPSARRATGGTSASGESRCYFYPRPPRGGRRT